MVGTEDNPMGRFSVEVELANYDDVVRARSGTISPAEVRRTTIRGLVDSGATRLVVPESLVTQLGLEMEGTPQVRYADGRRAQRPIARAIQLSYGGRASLFNAI